MKTKIVTRKSMIIRPSGRSTDFIAPSFINECAYNCSYCYVKRHNAQYITIAKNTMDILTEINSHAFFATVQKPNQTGDYISYDIGCNSDIGLHASQLEWQTIFKFFRDHPLAMGSFATKCVNKNLLDFNPEGKIRIRFSMMPAELQKLLEPNTAGIYERLFAVKLFLNAGYEVHLNFSPVIVHDNWLQSYMSLFNTIDGIAKSNGWADDRVKAEVIFLTHNEAKHWYNVEHKIPGEEFLWTPKIQEEKVSQYGGKNVKYEHKRKAEYIDQFRQIHTGILPWNTIRYIF
jgi:spore photoproduct lyase